ncbi:MAG: hypothetical protein IPG45_15005 [Deltaproteobacteria bacterium]|nr:hypothetical protein [Deltaproteobacteria bacterium]
MAFFDLDPTLYTQAAHLPNFDVAGGISLATSLRTGMHPKVTPTVKQAAKEMMAAADYLSEGWREEPVPTVDDRRPADAAVDRAWGAFFARLLAYSNLPADRYPKATEAGLMIRTLFPDGLTFLKLPYNKEWAESAKRLKRIDDDKLEPSLNAMAGHEFLAEVRRTHDVYGDVLGITKVAPANQAPVRAERLRELRRLMSRYVIRVLGLLGDDAESQAMVRQCLQPIDDFRAAQARRAATNAATVEPETETPETPDSPEAPVNPAPVRPASVVPAVAVPGAPNNAPS